ncbi:nucleotide exchange factor GrpE [Candidatus Liberibacter asiaticus]|uniref:Protein GrpE n=3 Tax=Liberibacter asiaticus TaxID=34021 RepID=C6XFM2_LIBAP|nr:heat shock protein [Candidatus Liberibacter asiaticus str. psy62]ALK07218.2 nucleotide exchange factor GrpE [Candidatus Liberibacter asiaticus]ASK52701.1 nucleotide exchange factor GrpE [Candidatus Liberibacter asiaticus]AWL14026.1 nucleotide exchange factor GrpE [Candidatus Liberibacter asiaticus]MBA2917392.1 nucleotide exchange factor GrpE [Candidatus Liberibacter asiaticus]
METFMSEKNIDKEKNPSNANSSTAEEKSEINIPEESLNQSEEFRDKYLRVIAEMENLRRRTDREKKDAQSYSIAKFARDMLSVSDNLSRALDSAPLDLANSEKKSESVLKSLIEGIEMTRREMMSTLERYGVKKIDAKDQKFNPNMHQAMFEEPHDTVPANTIIKVVQDGYAINERVLRPALVSISKGKTQNPTEEKKETIEQPSPLDIEERNKTQTKN